MKIISVHKGFACDHSSTSYELLAVDKPLGQAAIRSVSSLSSRAAPTRRRVSFIYHADGYDIPGGWERLMRKYYDVMYSESYGWWTLAVAFDAPKKQQHTIGQYEFFGMDDLGVSVSCDGGRVTIAINCHADNEVLYRLGRGHEDELSWFRFTKLGARLTELLVGEPPWPGRLPMSPGKLFRVVPARRGRNDQAPVSRGVHCAADPAEEFGRLRRSRRSTLRSVALRGSQGLVIQDGFRQGHHGSGRRL